LLFRHHLFLELRELAEGLPLLVGWAPSVLESDKFHGPCPLRLRGLCLCCLLDGPPSSSVLPNAARVAAGEQQDAK
jgi:hypothetical protein